MLLYASAKDVDAPKFEGVRVMLKNFVRKSGRLGARTKQYLSGKYVTSG